MGKKSFLIQHEKLPLVYNPISRRMFLRNMSGTFIAIPFLGSLLPRAAMAATEQDFRRAVFMVFRWGVHWYDWEPQNITYSNVAPNVRAGSLSSGQLGPIFNSDFTNLRSKMSVLLGLDGLNDGNHLYGSALAASCKPNIGGLQTESRVPESIDEILSKSSLVYPTNPGLRALRMNGYKSSTDTHCFRGGRSISGLTSSRAAFDLIKSSIVIEPPTMTPPGPTNPTSPMPTPPPSGPTVAQKLADRNKYTVDRVLEAANQMKQSRQMATEEVNILNNYMDMLSDIKENFNTSPLTQSAVQSSAVNRCENPQYISDSGNDGRAKNMVNAMVLGLACGVTKISYLQLYEDHTNAHDISSSAGRSRYRDHVRDRVIHIAAYAMNQMDSIRESNGNTLLENSVVLTTADEGSSFFDNHILASMPVLIGGNLNGKLRMGEVIDYRRNNVEHIVPTQPGLENGIRGGRAYNELLITIMRSFGLSQSAYRFNNQNGYGIYDTNFAPGTGSGNRRVRDWLRKYYYDENVNNLDQTLPYFYRG